MDIDAKLGLDVFKLDKEPHIEIDHAICRTVCAKKVCLTVCPADLYEPRRSRRRDGQLGGLPGVRHLPAVLRAGGAELEATRAASTACSTG